MRRNRTDYAINRYYSPDTGRFTTHDPLTELDRPERLNQPQGLNLYPYVMGGPTRYTDPDGLLGLPLIQSATNSGNGANSMPDGDANASRLQDDGGSTSASKPRGSSDPANRWATKTGRAYDRRVTRFWRQYEGRSFGDWTVKSVNREILPGTKPDVLFVNGKEKVVVVFDATSQPSKGHLAKGARYQAALQKMYPEYRVIYKEGYWRNRLEFTWEGLSRSGELYFPGNSKPVEPGVSVAPREPVTSGAGVKEPAVRVGETPTKPSANVAPREPAMASTGSRTSAVIGAASTVNNFLAIVGVVMGSYEYASQQDDLEEFGYYVDPLGAYRIGDTEKAGRYIPEATRIDWMWTPEFTQPFWVHQGRFIHPQGSSDLELIIKDGDPSVVVSFPET